MRYLPYLVSSLLLFACEKHSSLSPAVDSGVPGGSVSDASPGVSPDGQWDDTMEAVCRADCEFLSRCGKGATTPGSDASAADIYASCMASCSSGGSGVYKPGVLTSMATCFAGLTCSQHDDSCLLQALETQNPDWQNDASYQACLARDAECENAGMSSFLDDDCVLLFLAAEQTVSAMKACLARPCAEIRDCLSGLVGK
jgi:hypothetical protein